MAKTYPGSYDRHGNQWRVRLSVGGRRYRFMLDGKRSEEDVQQFCRVKSAELHGMSGRALPGPMPFSDLLARYEKNELPGKAPNTRRTYRLSLTAFRTYFVELGKDPMAHEIRKGHVAGFLEWRRTHRPDGTECKPVGFRTLAKDRVTLSAVFEYALPLEVVEKNVVLETKGPEGDAREPIILDTDQYEALLTACEGRPMLSLYVLTLGETGLRCESECLWLRWEDVDLQEGFLHVVTGRDGHRTKTGKSRWVPITPRLRDALREHMATYRLKTYRSLDTLGHVQEERSPWIFHHETDRRRATAGQRIGTLRRAFDAAVKRAKLPKELNQHDLRHTRVTTWLAAGQPPHLVKRAMGHSSFKTTEGYYSFMKEHLRPLVAEEAKREELKEMVR